MEYIMYLAIAGVITIVLTLIICSVAILKIFKAFCRQDQIIELQNLQYDALKTVHERDVATGEFLYEMLMDLVTPMHDETIIYKARTIQVILMIIDFQGTLKFKNMDHIHQVLNTPTLKHVDDAVHQILSDHKGTDILEENTISAYERFMKLIEDIERDETEACEKLQKMHSDISTQITITDVAAIVDDLDDTDAIADVANHVDETEVEKSKELDAESLV